MAGAILSCALGMATKEVMVTAPLVVWAWDWVFGGRPPARTRWPLLCGLAATWLLFAALVLRAFRTPSLDLGVGMAWRYLLTQAEVVTHYLRVAVAASPLVFLYTWPLAGSAAEVAPQAMAMAALVAGTAVALARRKALGFAGAWFFVILAPTSSVVPIVTEVAAEHRMYLPLASVIACALYGPAVNDLGRRIESLVPAAP